jgi:hypothetical protein
MIKWIKREVRFAPYEKIVGLDKTTKEIIFEITILDKLQTQKEYHLFDLKNSSHHYFLSKHAAKSFAVLKYLERQPIFARSEKIPNLNFSTTCETKNDQT